MVAGPGVARAMLAAGLIAVLTATATPWVRLRNGGGNEKPTMRKSCGAREGDRAKVEV